MKHTETNTKRFGFKSLYAKVTVIFLCLWWGLNLIILGVMLWVVTIDRLQILFPAVKAAGGQFRHFTLYTILAFVASIVIGTVIIMLIVRGIVKPIMIISDAARRVAKGDFDVSVNVKSGDELGMLAEDFNTMTRELKSIDAMRGEFVSSVSHEFRTPVTSIKGYTELLRDDAAHTDELADEKRLEYCYIILNESERLIALSSNLLRLSEMDSQIIREDTSLFSVDEQIRKTIVILEPQWSVKNIEFHLDLDESDYFGEKDLLQQVWLNILQNAIKFSHKNGSIAVTLRAEQKRLLVEIEDHGIGIAEADQARVFEAFYKGEKSRRGEGNGLGLVIVKRIVTLCGGNISMKSVQGQGTKFVVELPRMPD